MGADARRTQRRVQPGLLARRMMNRGLGGNKPMSMRRFPYIPAERRASIDTDMASTEDPYYAAFLKASKSLDRLSDSATGLEYLPFLCTNHSATNDSVKRDDAAAQYIAAVEEAAAEDADEFVEAAENFVEATEKLSNDLDMLSYLNILWNCDRKVFCKNLEFALTQEMDDDELEDVQKVNDEFC